MWPAELLGRFLHFLALDGAERTWHHLAYLTCNNSDLYQVARQMERPLVLRIYIVDESSEAPLRKFVFPFYQATVVNIEIHWGDGSIDIVQDKNVKFVAHEYASAGEYTVRVFRARKIGDTLEHKEAALDHLGLEYGKRLHFWSTPLRSMDTLGDLGIRSLSHLFYRALSFNEDIARLNVSKIECMKAMFFGALAFNQPIGDWNVGKVTDMSQMFHMASQFNQPLGRWDVSSVTTFESMFSACGAFNQPLEDWDMKNAKDIMFIFKGATRFNQRLERWQIGPDTNMWCAFSGSGCSETLPKWY
jgi:surface protein